MCRSELAVHLNGFASSSLYSSMNCKRGLSIRLMEPQTPHRSQQASKGLLCVEAATSLHQAAQNGHSAIAKLLLDAGTNPNIQDEFGNTPLHDAVLWGHENVAKLLLNAGANPDIRNDGGTVPLHNAARWGRDAVAKLLLEAGANQTIKDEFGAPLHLAAFWGRDAFAKRLLEHG